MNSTQRAYRFGEKQYSEFCASARFTPFPATESVLSAIVAFLYLEGLAASTVKSYLSEVRHAQIALGWGTPVWRICPSWNMSPRVSGRRLLANPNAAAYLSRRPYSGN